MQQVLCYMLLKALLLSASTLACAQTFAPYIDNEWPDSRYIINADNTVTDTITNLIWQRCAQGQDQNSTNCSGSATTHDWQEALQLAENATTAGFTDWRLPNIEELRTIMAQDRFNPSINTFAFPNTVSDSYRSSSPHASLTDQSWIGNFDLGVVDSTFRASIININTAVRLVRGGQ